MKIKFYEVVYPLHDAPNVEPSHFQASLEYSGETLASIISEVENSTQIDVYDDEDNLTATYRNYTDLVAVCYGGAENPVVSVEFNNVDVQAQIDQIAQEQTTQATAIDDLTTQVSEITPYSDKKTAYIDDTEVVFTSVPSGALLVSFSNGNTSYSISREDGVLTVGFAPFDEVVEVTITVQ